MFSLVRSIIEKFKFSLYLKKVIIGVNKEEKKIVIKNESHHYYSSLPLPAETILNSSSEEIGSFFKHMTYLNTKAALKNKPKEMNDFLTKYEYDVLSSGVSIVTVRAIISDVPKQKIKLEDSVQPMPSGDFVEQIPKAIKEIKINETINSREKINIRVVEKEKE